MTRATHRLDRCFSPLRGACVVGFVVIGVGLLFYDGSETSKASSPLDSVVRVSVGDNPLSVRSEYRLKNIEDVQVGDRVLGRNPVLDAKERAQLSDPDPATWRKLTLHMRKENGLSLWIDLLRPVHWLERHSARVGQSIYVDLSRMGAVGFARVTHVDSCPAIASGKGTVVTGKFIHQASRDSIVVRLRLEGQKEETCVTNNHPYWSEDRKTFVEVGHLLVGERINTILGRQRVVSITPNANFDGLLYNLETIEHVYRVGSLGTLVHNDCVAYARNVLRRRPDGAIIRMEPIGGGRTTGSLPGYPVSIQN